jgi:hypothetical protein
MVQPSVVHRDKDIIFAVNYFKTGDGTGAINNAITNIIEEPGTGAFLGTYPRRIRLSL